MRFRIAFLTLALAALACNALLPPRPELKWDTSPDALIIETYVAGGLVPINYQKNYIPEARVWGDGRILWVESSGGTRRVLEGHLSEDELRALLQKISEAGFFGWDDFYQPREMVYDAGTTTLTVNLLDTHKSVSEYFQGAPAKFHELAAYLGDGAGASGADFVPTRAYLTALPFGDDNIKSDYVWPDESAGFTLAEAVGGRYIEGEALEFAWQVVKQSMNAILESGGQRYQLLVQVPGVSLEAPP
jgi:hypothetical protein